MGPVYSPPQQTMTTSYPYSFSPTGPAPSFDDRISAGSTVTTITTILLRKLPRSTTPEALRTMLLFAKGLKEIDFVQSEYEEDQGFTSAIARFETAAAASEAQAMLDGKPNTTGQANMIVTMVGDSSPAWGNSLDQNAMHGTAQSASPSTSSNQLSRQSSRFNGTFQSLEKMSPPNISAPITESSSNGGPHLPSIFSPQSPVGGMLPERSRISGKSVIDEDAADDDTGELLKDPVAYMQNDHSASTIGLPRRSTNSQIPLSRFSNLSLNTNVTSPPPSQFASSRANINNHTPISAMSPTMGNMGLNPGYPVGNPHYHRHNYPPVNPADQNPPCNTLYVGNLPIDTSEDELKNMFSKQRGYKRLCFRTKQNGPMCFVEFEDVSFATRALTELYGAPLHNSAKGGIRLSFSKNPLGVRTGQPGAVNPSTPLSPQGPISHLNGITSMSPAGYTNTNGPPPGLSVPPGLSMPLGVSSPGMTSPMTPSLMHGGFPNSGLGIGGPGVTTVRGIPLHGGMNGTSATPTMGNAYPDYMMGR
jgi:hypothetical protein